MSNFNRRLRVILETISSDLDPDWTLPQYADDIKAIGTHHDQGESISIATNGDNLYITWANDAEETIPPEDFEKYLHQVISVLHPLYIIPDYDPDDAPNLTTALEYLDDDNLIRRDGEKYKVIDSFRHIPAEILNKTPEYAWIHKVPIKVFREILKIRHDYFPTELLAKLNTISNYGPSSKKSGFVAKQLVKIADKLGVNIFNNVFMEQAIYFIGDDELIKAAESVGIQVPDDIKEKITAAFREEYDEY